VTPDIFHFEARPGDMFLLCSDGLTREVADAKIEAILLSGAPVESLCKQLVLAANQAGGGDNITCVLVQVTE
jgi:protein phosphatase